MHVFARSKTTVIMPIELIDLYPINEFSILQASSNLHVIMKITDISVIICIISGCLLSHSGWLQCL